MVHVGIGYDVHCLVPDRKLVLGGVEIPHNKGLDGHSDADALLHAITDAVLGAIGEVDIGHLFPNTDPAWRNAPSRILLEEAARPVQARGGRTVNISAPPIPQPPIQLPHIPTVFHTCRIRQQPKRRVEENGEKGRIVALEKGAGNRLVPGGHI